MASTPPVYLIAEREFRAYVATASFWVALIIGPLLMAGLLLFTGLSTGAKPCPVAVVSDQPAVSAAVFGALRAAGTLEGQDFIRSTDPATARRVMVSRGGDGQLILRFEGSVPLPATGRELVARTVERDEAVLALSQGHQSPLAPVVQSAVAKPVDADAAARFALVVMLWLTLTGSLGMLLQAVVRERANRALETLLAAARPWEIVFGKLAGVGGVSLLVLVAWLGSSAAMAALTPAAGGLAGNLLHAMTRPWLLVQAGVIYILAFGFFGLITIAVGASAADSAAAQNQARPMFGVLLAAFFVALAIGTGGAAPLHWLIMAPPFAPFILLLSPHAATTTLASLAILCLATGASAWIAVGRLTLDGVNRSIPIRLKTWLGRPPCIGRSSVA